MKPYFLIIIVVMLFACNTVSKQNEDAKVDSAGAGSATTVSLTGEHCYSFVAAKDTYALKINIVDKRVNGTAVYQNYEKDSSHGTVEGEIEGDIIHLWYHFQSEGMNSVRELFFKKEGDQLVSGISAEVSKGDTAYVPDAKAVQYTGPVYIKGDCGQVPQL